MMAKPAEQSSSKVHAMIAAAEARVAARAISTILIAVAGAITLVAIAYAIYAGLRGPLSPAAASAGTAFLFALITAALAFLGPKVIRARASAAETQSAISQPNIGASIVMTGVEVGLAIISAALATGRGRRGRG